MRPAEVLRRASGYLDRHGVESPDATAEILLMHVRARTARGCTHARRGSTHVRPVCSARDLSAVRGTPVQHLTGDQPFRGITLEVRPGVFVPRPETELLVEHALAEAGDREDPVVVDAGTAPARSRCPSSRSEPDAMVFATDLSAEAVELARANAARLGLAVTVLEGDLLESLPVVLRGWVDIVVSKPAVRTGGGVRGPSGRGAGRSRPLAGGDRDLRRAGRTGIRWLRGGGLLAVEIDARLGDDVVRALSSAFAEVRVEPDLTGRDRVVLARAP